jgi:hypothetical protein
MAQNEVQREPNSPGPTRMTTRAKNAATHPGTILQGGRRTRQEVAEEKALKNMKTEVKRQKKIADEARKVSGEARITLLEGINAAAAANAESEFPRHRGLRPFATLKYNF